MMRAQCQELDRPSRDLVVMGFLMAAQDTRGELDYNVTHRNTRKEKDLENHTTMQATRYYTIDVISDNFRNTEQVCRKTFLFLHSIGANQFKLIKNHNYKWTNTQVLK